MNSSLSIPPRTLRVAALAIACTAVLILMALFHHPVVSGAANAREAHAEMARLGAKDNLVHGSLTAMLVVLASALAVFDRLLGGPRWASGGARGAYFLGCVLLGVAMLFDGFVLPAVATRFLSANPFDTAVVARIVSVIGIVVQEFSKAGLVSHCVAMLAWSYAAATAPARLPGWRWCAALGFLAGLLPATCILFGDVRLTPHSLMAIFGVYAIWYLAAAASMYRASLDGGMRPDPLKRCAG